MKSTYTRDVSPEMMEELQNRDTFAAFVDYVKTCENKDLALCFRGNDSEIGKAVIYRNNHMIWELRVNDGVPTVRINPNHARFMLDWNSRVVKDLMEMGFRGPKGQDYAELEAENGFVKRHKTNGRYYYDAVYLEYLPKGGYQEVMKVVIASYEILKEMQESYFSLDHDEEFEVYYPRSAKTKREKRPRNYIKQYFFEHNPDAKKVDPNDRFYANFQPCVEKHVQQELFMNNHFLKGGLFIYDLEFAQPGNVPGVSVKSKNEPDMFALRFDPDGKIIAICMIEVKSTKTALGQNSGLEAHLDGMEKYFTIPKQDGMLMDDRINEARKILNQYHKLGYYGVTREFFESEFADIKKEIIFVFSNELDINTKVHRGIKIKDALPGYDSYEEMHYGEYVEHPLVLKKEYS